MADALLLEGRGWVSEWVGEVLEERTVERGGLFGFAACAEFCRAYKQYKQYKQ